VWVGEPGLFDVQVTVHREKFLKINQPDALSSHIYFGMKLYTFRTFPLSIIRSFPLYTQQWYMSYRFADSLRAGSGCSTLILHASCQQTCMTYTIAVCTVKNSWWWTEELSETCTVSFQEWIWEISASGWFIVRNKPGMYLLESALG